MNEKPKPSLRDRVSKAAAPMIAVGLIGLGGMIADVKITLNAVDNEVNRTFPPSASSEEPTKARKEITIYDRDSHKLIQQGETAISISKITDPSKLQQAITLLDEEQKRQKQAASLSHRLSMPLFRRNIVTGTVSTVLAFTGLFLLIRPQENTRKPTETIQQTNLTT